MLQHQVPFWFRVGAQVVAPKRAALAEANRKLSDANKKLESIRARVKELNDRVASLEDSLMKVAQRCCFSLTDVGVVGSEDSTMAHPCIGHLCSHASMFHTIG